MDVYRQEKENLLNDFLDRVERTVSLTRYPSWKELQLVAQKATKMKFKMMVDYLRHDCSNCHQVFHEASTAIDDWCDNHVGKNDPWKNNAKFKVMRQCKLTIHQRIRCAFPDLVAACDDADKEVTEYAGKYVIKHGKHKGLMVNQLDPCHLLKLVMSHQTPKRLKVAIHDHLHSILVSL